MLNSDNNTQATLFRIRKGGDMGRNFRALQDYALTNYGRPWKLTRGQVATVLGKRNGVPDHQAQDIYVQQKKQMNQRTRYPYRSNETKDLLPTIYNGNTNILRYKWQQHHAGNVSRIFKSTAFATFND